jgi:hypothetical protein
MIKVTPIDIHDNHLPRPFLLAVLHCVTFTLNVSFLRLHALHWYTQNGIMIVKTNWYTVDMFFPKVKCKIDAER